MDQNKIIPFGKMESRPDVTINEERMTKYSLYAFKWAKAECETYFPEGPRKLQLEPLSDGCDKYSVHVSLFPFPEKENYALLRVLYIEERKIDYVLVVNLQELLRESNETTMRFIRNGVYAYLRETKPDYWVKNCL